VSKAGTQRHVRKAIQHAMKLEGAKRHVTLVHKGNIMKFTEGAFRDWGYEVATSEFRDVCVTERESWILDNLARNHGLSVEDNSRLIEPGYDSLTPEKKAAVDTEVKEVLAAIGESHGYGKWKSMVLVDDRIADSIFQQIQTRPQEYSVLCTLNLNGDPWHGTQARRSRPHQSRLGDPLGRDDARIHGLARGRRSDHPRHQRGDRERPGHLRPRQTDGTSS
jgi:isocitrate dehydrogenase